MTVRIRDNRAPRAHPGCGGAFYLVGLALLCLLLPLTWKS